MASGMPALEIDFSWSCIKPPGSERSVGGTTPPLQTLHFVAAKLAEEHGQRIVKLVHHALLERNDGVVSDANLLRANFGATLRDVAKADPKLILEQAGAVASARRPQPRRLAQGSAWDRLLQHHEVLHRSLPGGNSHHRQRDHSAQGARGGRVLRSVDNALSQVSRRQSAEFVAAGLFRQRFSRIREVLCKTN